MAVFCRCVCVWSHSPLMHVQYDVMRSNQADTEAVLQQHGRSHVNLPHYRLVSRSLMSPICSFWLQSTSSFAMLSLQLQTYTLTLDDGAYQGSYLNIQEWSFCLCLWYKSDVVPLLYWDKLLLTCWTWVHVCWSYFCKTTELQTQNPTAAVLLGELSLRNMIWAPLFCTDPSISSRGLSAIIQSC